MTATVPKTTATVDGALSNLRVCRGGMLSCAAALDQPETREAHHALLLSLAELDDCLAELEKPEPPTLVFSRTRDFIADDRRDDLMADADRSNL